MIEKFKNTKIGKLFLDKKFLHYTWIGIFISVLNIFLLWLFIDIFGIPTIISSTVIIGATFIIRYVLFRRFEAI
ncbi:MAG: hypothetical protein A2832_00705 [Candidatus Zambryskibacteria bacterium RIFCSPHIGHO2_01_FULL_44_22b]|uniref:GtrA/DPMS transmembrane domain-containing protein n=1 Tax=Candidatus Zambryskibacteria bacterium RIFCSPHIGHO2_01_FULL_44_22b TaxID=1802737 RepID=A0A1G2T1T2_9BACT|nr:MAG: hypothetical protein A3A98_02930 [Candidatus Staskawiczbacteria bacterium RIFCSPLOWO2_01_FULL_40_39]OHA91082.1 MAG: hypothetical protein A2832_00705 [Candidatus Zambryskibacteria bacterium RIFCSPHIGHO2_01_FULL_44_22b]